MSAYTDIGLAEAEAVLAEAQAIGQQFTLAHRDGSANTLWGLLTEQTLEASSRGGLESSTGILDILIPVQTNFAVMSNNQRPVISGDKIVWSSRTFFVRSNNDIEQQANGYIYRVIAIEEKIITEGHKS